MTKKVINISSLLKILIVKIIVKKRENSFKKILKLIMSLWPTLHLSKF